MKKFYNGIKYLCYHGAFNWLSDEQYIRLLYFATFRKQIDLNNPCTFNEKLQWLKLYNRKSEYTSMVDKYKVKAFVRNRIGEEYIIPTLGLWNSAEDIDFHMLPSQFVLKCTHDSGGIVICRDKDQLDVGLAKKKLQKALKRSFFLLGREWPYKNVKPRIIAEKFMEDKILNELRDYKFFCFNGVVKCYKVDFDRFTSHHANYYDPNAKLLKVGETVCPPDFNKHIQQPRNLALMISLAEKLATDIPFLRVDFYEVDDRIYFGELTFFPASGFGPFVYEDNDLFLGGLLKLPNKEVQ